MINLSLFLEKLEKISKDVSLVAVSKNVGVDEVKNLFSQGQIHFGENRVQELAFKQNELKELNLKWHMIGRLQNNKINQLISLKPVLWQSCDSLERALNVNKRLDYTLDTLLQINSANEESKQGVLPQEALEVYEKINNSCPNINLVGVMSIGANSSDIREIIKSFEITRKIYENLIPKRAKICSMGMSSDYEIAVKSGSNMIRLGSMLYE